MSAPTPEDQTLSLRAMHLASQGLSPAIIANMLQSRLPGLGTEEATWYANRGQSLDRVRGIVDTLPEAATLQSGLGGVVPLSANARGDAIVVITTDRGDAIYRTVRVSLPWSATVADYMDAINEVVNDWRGRYPNSGFNIASPFNSLF